MNQQQAIEYMNAAGAKRQAFFFIMNFKGDECQVFGPEEAASQNIFFNFEGNHANYPLSDDLDENVVIQANPIDFEQYQQAFSLVQKHLNRGNAYLVNLTFPTPVKSSHALKAIFHSAKARYRIYYQNRFVVFSPETFVKIANNTIETFPMKGTIDADLPDAEKILMNNLKEQAEHATIVDLLRNDLSRVARHVQVEKFRYIEKITSPNRNLLQVSSKITGKLSEGFESRLGEILYALVPAGSISGAPKAKTLEIIEEAESDQRGYYTGIAGFFDGMTLNSCVMIRFIEQNHHQLIYRSGGGITTQSIAQEEYQEIIQKIYVPTR
ncbi:MAG: aminodeoxychorismate synthase component I [Prolixibacteraceae bacterium]|nr:aminodeoxychorismate synthase component I [Prolixibacteraceae bacterium]